MEEELSLPDVLSSLLLFDEGGPPGDLDCGIPFEEFLGSPLWLRSSSPSLHCSTSTSSSFSNLPSCGIGETGAGDRVFWPLVEHKICFEGGDVERDRMCVCVNSGNPWLARACAATGRCMWLDCCCGDCD